MQLNVFPDFINLVDTPPVLRRLAVQRNGQTFYAKLGKTNHPQATRLKVQSNGKTFAAIKNFDPLLFDECGNIWQVFSGNPYVSNGKLVFPSSGINALWCPNTIDLLGQDTTIELLFSSAVSSITARVVSLETPTDGDVTPFCMYIIRRSNPPTVRMRLQQNDNDSIKNCDINVSTSAENSVHHIAWCYHHNSATVQGFIDGVPTRIVPITYSPPARQPLYIVLGAWSYDFSTRTPNTNYYLTNATIDELRISDGICRYSDSFTPPSQPFEVDQFTKVLMHF